MITDSCNCERGGHGCKGLTRSHQPTWCPACERNKVKRRCQSEGLYQEGDPLKELNWCCDRGCDLHNHSSKFSQIKKTEIQMNEKKISYLEVTDMDGGDNYLGVHRKHHSRFFNEKVDTDFGSPKKNSLCEVSTGLEFIKSSKSQKYHEVSPERCRPYNSHQENSNMPTYHAVGDYNTLTAGKPLEKDISSNEMRDRYIEEMEILRTKLNLLKDGIGSDGKRMRQRSESEPGFTDLSGGVPKRARDNSSKIKLTGRKLPLSPDFNHSWHISPMKQNLLFHGTNKNFSLSTKSFLQEDGEQTSDLIKYSPSSNDIRGLTVSESDEYNGESISEENSDCITAGNSDDDDTSISSNATTASSDSNTPSKVGECLGSITLNEQPQEINSCNKVANEQPLNSNIGKEDLFRGSLFPNVPPYIKFFMHDLKGPMLPSEIRQHLKWRLSSITPIVIRRTLLNSGFKLVRSELIQESNEWTGQWGKHMKSFVFKTLKDFQKLNHFPGTFQIGRKDKLWKNLYRLMVKFGKKEFGFIPKTYILPQDRKLLRTAWEKASGPGKGQWIVKPPAAARGTGIKVVHRWGQIPKKKSLIVQKYIAQPYLINGSKFDLRLYVLMTSIHPLRIYLYDDGLVRFASVKYSDNVECLSNRFMHLTNYSINKLSNQYQVNADASSCHGHKWSLKSLWTYLAKEGVNVKKLRKNLTDLVIKTIISGESNINMLSKNNLPSRYCSYELFGIDVLLDHTLKPWLLEVNISPSLHSASPLDLAVKGPLVKELLNIAGFQIPAKLSKDQEDNYLNNYGLKDGTHTLCYDKRLYWMSLSKEEKAKQESFQNLPRKMYLQTILENLTPDDVRHLIQFEDELTQLDRFEKIFPTSHTHTYHQFFESPRYYNMMFDAWEVKYQKDRASGIRLLSSLCRENVHLNISLSGGNAMSSPSPSRSISPPIKEELESDLKDEKEFAAEDEVDREEHQENNKSSSSVKGSLKKQKILSKPAVVSKPSGISTHTGSRRLKTPVSSFRSTGGSRDKNSAEAKSESHSPLNETCMKMLTEMRQGGLKFSPERKQEKLKQFANCKLETSILSESLKNGKNLLSPTKHIHNACIKMNSSG